MRVKSMDGAYRLIAVAGMCREEDRQRAWEAGFAERLVNPVRLEKPKGVLVT